MEGKHGQALGQPVGSPPVLGTGPERLRVPQTLNHSRVFSCSSLKVSNWWHVFRTGTYKLAGPRANQSRAVPREGGGWGWGDPSFSLGGQRRPQLAALGPCRWLGLGLPRRRGVSWEGLRAPGAPRMLECSVSCAGWWLKVGTLYTNLLSCAPATRTVPLRLATRQSKSACHARSYS